MSFSFLALMGALDRRRTWGRIVVVLRRGPARQVLPEPWQEQFQASLGISLYAREPGSLGIGHMGQGTLESKYEKLLVLGVISVRPDAEQAKRIQQGDPEAIAMYFRNVETSVKTMLMLVLRKCRSTLEPSNSWKQLAKEPKRFDAALNRLLTGALRPA
jgi:hypothetical protein